VTPGRVEERLAELGRRTAALGARPGFQARVLFAVAREAAAFPVELARSGRRFVPLAFVLALAAVGWASRSDGLTSAELARAELSWELTW
jgi:hypothetical protein